MLFEEKIEQLKQKLIGSCPKCKGEGFLEDGTTCSCRLEFRVINRLLPRGFQEEYLLLDKKEILKNIKIGKEDKMILNWYLEHFDEVSVKGLSLYIYGGAVGIGKTSLAIMIAKEYAAWSLSDKNYIWDFDAFYMDMLTFCDSLKQDDFIESEKWRAKFFVLDEFGRDALEDKAKDWIVRGLERFFRFRIAWRLPTIICSNIIPEKLYDIYGERISSLLGIVGKEMFGLVYRSIKLLGEDLRRGWIKSRWEK